MVEKYRMEARAAQQLHTAPLASDENTLLPAKIHDTDLSNNIVRPVATDSHQTGYEGDRHTSNRPAEDGITEVELPPFPREAPSTAPYFSPLTTASRCAGEPYSDSVMQKDRAERL